MTNNRIEITHPEIAEEFDIEKNTIDIKTISHGSTKKVWWTCKKHKHSWESIVSNRTNKYRQRGCPYCTNQKPLKGFNTLEDKYPELAIEFDTKRNKMEAYELVYGSNKKVWWKCSNCYHSWEAPVAKRTGEYKYGCPKCSKQGTSYIEQLIFVVIKENFCGTKNRAIINEYEYDIHIPEINILIEYDGAYWHDKSRGRKWIEHEKDLNASRLGISMIRIKEDKNIDKPYRNVNKRIIYWNGSSRNKDIQAMIDELGAYIESEFNMRIKTEIRDENKKEAYSKSRGVNYTNSVAYKFPNIALEWDIDNNIASADKVSYGSHEVANWICHKDKRHKWEAVIQSRTIGGLGCPICSNQKVIQGINDVETTHSFIIKDWDYNVNIKNGVYANNIVAGSGKQVNWICHKCGRKWVSRLVERTAKHQRCKCRAQFIEFDTTIEYTIENVPDIQAKVEYCKILSYDYIEINVLSDVVVNILKLLKRDNINMFERMIDREELNASNAKILEYEDGQLVVQNRISRRKSMTTHRFISELNVFVDVYGNHKALKLIKDIVKIIGISESDILIKFK